MHMALAEDQWLNQNTLFCNRLHARLTPAVCRANQRSVDDCRCHGCSGLEDQERKLPRREPVIVLADPEPEQAIERETEACDEYWLDTEEPELEAEEELSDLHRCLLELIDQEEEEAPQRRPEHRRPRKVAVFMGRCPRCSGYMTEAPEQQFEVRDNEVYRCFSCGYRSSPSYQWNRKQVPEQKGFLSKGGK